MLRLGFQATLICGTLDILGAMAFAGMAGRSPVQVLQAVASGPLGSWPTRAGYAGVATGLIVHFAIMSVMVAVFLVAVHRTTSLAASPVISALAYSLLLYLIMYWIVLPLRWPRMYPQTGAWDVGSALFLHLVCVGLPLGLLTTFALRRS